MLCSGVFTIRNTPHLSANKKIYLSCQHDEILLTECSKLHCGAVSFLEKQKLAFIAVSHLFSARGSVSIWRGMLAFLNNPGTKRVMCNCGWQTRAGLSRKYIHHETIRLLAMTGILMHGNVEKDSSK